jgi:NADH-quinone oxidoreductase subunit E
MEQVLTGLENEIEKIMARYPTRRSGMIPVLWLVQRKMGYVPDWTYPEIGECVGAHPTEVSEAVSFYTMFHRQPVGKYVLQVCRTLPCALCGGLGLSGYLQEKLGVGLDETTEDGLFTIQEVECLGACSEAPLMLVNEKLETRLTHEKVDAILARCMNEAGTTASQVS